MGIETERKFLINGEDWKTLAKGVYYSQGYLRSDTLCTVRVRITETEAFLTVKGPTLGASRLEFEYPIPREEAEIMLRELAEKPLIEKKRYTIPHADRVWEVDEFLGDNAGLVVAEVEVPHENAPLIKPAWVGAEVTGDPRYYNAALVTVPFSRWKKG